MKPDELKRFRERFRLTQMELAAILDVKQSTIWRWESGAVTIPRTVEFAVRYLKTQYSNTKQKRSR
jgi:DNA-binding transcriptional regulator YiaG